MGTLIGSAVAPIALGIMSRRANKIACISGAWAGLAAGIVAWLVTTATLNGGVITVSTTGQDYPMLAGNLAALGVGSIISVGGTLLWPANYVFEGAAALAAMTQPEHTSENEEAKDAKMNGEDVDEKNVSVTATSDVQDQLPKEAMEGEDEVSLRKAFRFAVILSVVLTAILLILVSSLVIGTL